jgi:hypothetical protein
VVYPPDEKELDDHFKECNKEVKDSFRSYVSSMFDKLAQGKRTGVLFMVV